MKNGLGVYTFADGSKYSGEFVNNEYHGMGKFEWFDGKVYEGNW